MSRLYQSPLRVYVLLAVLACAGIFSGLKLPISLFPNSAKPTVTVRLSYGNSTSEEFLNTYGKELEEKIHAISVGPLEVENIQSRYDSEDVVYDIYFKWGGSPREALREVQSTVTSASASFPKEVRDSVSVWNNNENGGFLAISFFSESRSLDDLYDVLDPLIVPGMRAVSDAEDPELWNPNRKEIRVELNPLKMAPLQLYPRDIENAISSSLRSYNGGAMTVGINQVKVQMPRMADSAQTLGRVPVTTASGRVVHLNDVAKIEYQSGSTSNRSFRTNGAASLILFATPRAGGNVKKMAEDIISVVKRAEPQFPKDVQYRVLVDPSEFIRDSIRNVFREVAMGCILAVAVLFLFIGSFKNIATAAIEIPMSMVLAFILMKLSGMNLNLISLGGLALSAGMNVDASVVVMENIFRHLEMHKGILDARTRLRIVLEAVSEVRFPVIASTVSSLVVFLPLAFTSALTSAILGDLAKTVVFSHGFSAIVALLLVPTVRLHLMQSGVDHAGSSPIEKWLRMLEKTYGNVLSWFMARRSVKIVTYVGVLLGLGLLIGFVLPRLPREIIGVPDTDWIMVGTNTQGNTTIRQMESQMEEVEADLLKKFGHEIQYTFSQVNNPNRSWIMARLKDKEKMQQLWKEFETAFVNTPFLRFRVMPWNPSELPIPDPPQLRLVVSGGEAIDRIQIAQEVNAVLEGSHEWFRVSSDPDIETRKSAILRADPEQWSQLQLSGSRMHPGDVADIARVATSGRKIDDLPVKGRSTPVIMSYPINGVNSVEALEALPVGIAGRIVPLKALAAVHYREAATSIYREDNRSIVVLKARTRQGEEMTGPARRAKSQELVEKWKMEHPERLQKTGVTLSFEDSEKDLTEALHQLTLAIGLSVVLMLLTLVLQFGDLMSALLVLVAVPLGFVGVILSLWIFQSTLSLNSALGVILLNGIAVANSIILVDFMKKRMEAGLSPQEAAVDSGMKRLRPILITSLTTILGMLPIAFGFGEGGKILQPLGIAVSGGLWVSMALTLLIVPALQADYLSFRLKRRARRISPLPELA